MTKIYNLLCEHAKEGIIKKSKASDLIQITPGLTIPVGYYSQDIWNEMEKLGFIHQNEKWIMLCSFK